ncbi:poly(A) polymerase [Mycolicibacterium sp. BK634]|uniref:CCA tRNA nucleotidyltransferase n=1 Tax=Mycolicibacterium sp. BK634 TaxID=2587099 RepID=UPI001610EDFF|nr:hypothetical protein [Mycolicibacterium sp. BK634]MBB3752648.1 poly(A) polymerase [Mycolicibacterium sp. BK634]
MMIRIGSAVDTILRELGTLFDDAGHGLYLVGGSVRDLVLDKEPKDWDFTTDARPDQIESIITGWSDALWDIGREFGTIAARKGDITVEITTFRFDGPGRKPEVTFTDDITKDLARRDFTINAMAIPVTGAPLTYTGSNIIDPFGGLLALARRRIVTPLDPEITFSEDPLRMLRAARFVSQLGFRLYIPVFNAMVAKKQLIDTISRERVLVEMDKLLTGMEPRKAVQLLASTGLLQLIATGADRDPLIGSEAPVEVAWAILLGNLTPDHVAQRLEILKASRERVRTVKRLVELKRKFSDSRMASYRDVRQFLHDAGELRELALIHWDDDHWNERVAHILATQGEPALPLTGDEIMEICKLKPGPIVGQGIDALWKAVINRGPLTRNEAIDVAMFGTAAAWTSAQVVHQRGSLLRRDGSAWRGIGHTGGCSPLSSLANHMTGPVEVVIDAKGRLVYDLSEIPSFYGDARTLLADYLSEDVA